MTEKRFEVVMNEFDEVEYIMDKIAMEDRDFAEFIDFVEDVCKENEQLKQQLSDIRGQLVMLDNCDNWDYDGMKDTVREIAEIVRYTGTINPKR